MRKIARHGYRACGVGGSAIVAILAGWCNQSFAAIEISNSATSNMSCLAGMCTPTAKSAVLNVADLEAMLATGDVTITTTGADVEARDIRIEIPLSWSTLNGLELAAKQFVTIDAPVSVDATAALTLTTGKHGRLLFGQRGRIAFANLSSALTINSASYVLVNDIKSLAADISADPAGDFALANDYDAAPDGVYKQAPVPTAVQGIVDGLGNTIKHLRGNFASRSAPALFSAVDATGVIENIRLSRVSLEFKLKSGGGAGLVGLNYGLVSHDSVDGVFRAPTCCSVSGLVGGNVGGTIEYSYADVQITTIAGAAGLVVYNGGNINSSHSSGNVQTAGQEAGGLVQHNFGYINDSYSTVDVQGGDSSDDGGLTGYDNGETTDSYATGSVTGGANAHVGGISGFAGAYFFTSYSTGPVQGGAGSAVGGFVGTEEDSQATNCYWNTTTSDTDQGSGYGDLAGITGLTTEEFQSGLPEGFDPKVWAEKTKINNGLPYLIGNAPGRK